MEDLLNFGAQIDFEALTPTNTEFLENPSPSPLPGGRHLKHVFEHNLAPNYLTLSAHGELNTKKSISVILEFSTCSTVKKFHERNRLKYLKKKKKKKTTFGDFGIF